MNYLLRNQYSAAETLGILQKTFGDDVRSPKNVYKCYNDFIEAKESVEDEQLHGRPSMSTDEQEVNQIRDLVPENCQLTTRDLADTISISKGSVNIMVKDFLFLRRVKSRLAPKTLNFLEKIYEIMIFDFQHALKRIITRLGFMPTTRKQLIN